MTEHPRSHARLLVEIMRRGDDESMLLELARLTADRANGGRESHLVVGELVSALARMMAAASDPATSEEPVYGLELTNNDNQEVPIDEASPPVRATVRALLADLNGYPDEARFQLDLALRDNTFDVTLEVFAHALLWTIGMLKWCDSNKVSRPLWLGAMVPARRAAEGESWF
jgi:hypothetical protein